jgi:hypothetical protein
MEETRKRGRPRKRWPEEVEDGQQRIRNVHTVAKDRTEWMRILLEDKAHNGL